MAVPHGRWKTTTFVAGLTRRGMIARFVIGGPINRDAFETCLARAPVPELRPVRHRRSDRRRDDGSPS